MLYDRHYLVELRVFLSLVAAFVPDFLQSAQMLSTVGKVETPPLVDGIRDAVYDEAFPVTGFSIVGTMETYWNPTTIRFVHDGKFLYGFAACSQGNTKDLPPITSVRNDPNAWRGDSIELFFLSGDGMRQYAINASGNVYWDSARQDDANFWIHDKNPTSDIQVAASRGENCWQVEFAIPLSELPGRNWRVNFVRNMSGGRTSTWEPHEEMDWWQSRPAMGELRLSDNSIGRLSFSTMPQYDEKKNFVFAITNDKVREVVYRFAHVVPSPYIKISPANLNLGRYYLDGGPLHREARLSWRCRHNYPAADRTNGGRIRKPFVIRFAVPKGVKVVDATEVGNGVFEQRCPFAYTADHWLTSGMTCTLPEGTEGVVTYELVSDDFVQEKRNLPFRVVNIHPVRPPRRFLTGFYNINVKSLREAEKWSRLGINAFSVCGHDNAARELCKELMAGGFIVRRGDYFWPGAAPGEHREYERWAKEDESARALDINLKPIPSGSGFQISPTYRGRLYQESIEKEVAFNRATGANWCAFDMEGYIQRRGEYADFRPEMIAAFKDDWNKLHPGTEAPDPFVFERDPMRYPVEHRVWIASKCRIWGEFFQTMKDLICKGSGYPVVFSEWSMGNSRDIEARNKSMRGADFYRAFDYIELSGYAGIDRSLRQIAFCVDAFRDAFPSVPLRIIPTPSPCRLGDIDGPGTYYCTTAPRIKNEGICWFKEAATLGARGVYTWKINLADVEYLRQFTEGVRIIRQIEDIVLDGKPISLTSDSPSDARIIDKFFGKDQTWHDQPRVFVRGIGLGDRVLVSVSEYREVKPITVRVNYRPMLRMRARDVETGESLGIFTPQDEVIPVNLDVDRRCRLVLLEACSQ